jgi:hypothetical protein
VKFIFNLLRKLLFINFILIFCIFETSFALKERTHELLNGYIARSGLNGFNLTAYLKDTILLKDGINETLTYAGKSRRVYQWLEEGGRREDKPFEEWYRYTDNYNPAYGRFYCHFHNPLKELPVAGLWSIYPSAIAWAFRPVGCQGDTGNYSWHDVRQCFYTALTSQNKITREENLAKTFRGLGQLMHLVQDMSVPEHVRNDGHVIEMYEDWLDKSNNIRVSGKVIELTDKDNLLEAISLPNTDNPFVLFDFESVDNPTSYTGLIVENLFDANRYDGSNPGPTVAETNKFGLSEYTNANFISPDTIFQSNKFPYPRTKNDFSGLLSICYLEEHLDPLDGENEKYFSKCRHGETIKYFFRALRTGSYVPEGEVVNSYWIYMLNDSRVYANYAEKLIPRAVGYSAQLLEYFFRGKIEISLPDGGFYAKTNQVSPENGFTTLKLLAQNISDREEEMTGGFVDLVVKYRTSPCDPFTNDSIWDPTCNTQDIEFEYITVQYPEMVPIPGVDGPPIELEFTLNDPIPLWATDVYIFLVYRGALVKKDDTGTVLSYEAQAVAAGSKDVSEPTPIHIFNNMDKICLDTISPQGNRAKGWHDAGLPAISQVDTWEINKYGNNNGKGDEHDVYPHKISNLYVRFSTVNAPRTVGMNEDEYHYRFVNIAPGSLLNKMYLLTDSTVNSADSDPGNNMPDVFSTHVSLCFSSAAVEGPLKAEHDALWDHYTIAQKISGGMTSEFARKAVWNQWIVDSNGDYNRVVSLFNHFRENEMWGGTRIINSPYHPDTICDPENPESHCPMEDLNEP